MAQPKPSTVDFPVECKLPTFKVENGGGWGREGQEKINEEMEVEGFEREREVQALLEQEQSSEEAQLVLELEEELWTEQARLLSYPEEQEREGGLLLGF